MKIHQYEKFSSAEILPAPSITFSKMHGLGNDFMVIDGVNQQVSLTPECIWQWSQRHRGVGFDQLLLVEPGDREGVDFCYRIFNADGEEVEQCGNGARCFAQFVLSHNLTDKRCFQVSTLGGMITLKMEDDGQVTVNMGRPCLEPKRVPFLAKEQSTTYLLALSQKTVATSVLSMGNPHCVLIVDDVKTAPLQTIGREISQLSDFPQGVNVGFMEIISPREIALRVLERGVGETLACGTGACAAVVAGQLHEVLEDTVLVNLPGGQLTVSWQGSDHPVFMTGPAEHVYQGQIELPSLA